MYVRGSISWNKLFYGYPPVLYLPGMAASHLRFAWRTLRRHKGYTAITITSLAIGICPCIAIYTIASYELSFDDFHPDRQRIYRIGGRIKEHGQSLYGEGIAPAAAMALRSDIPGLEAVARYYPWPVAVTIPQKNPPLRRLSPPAFLVDICIGWSVGADHRFPDHRFPRHPRRTGEPLGQPAFRISPGYRTILNFSPTSLAMQ